MSNYIPKWATHYQLHSRPTGVKRHDIVLKFCAANPETVSMWKPIENLARDLAIADVCQQIKAKPLHSRIDVVGQNGNDGLHYDEINPDHYKQGSVECIEAIESALTDDEYRGYLKGNMIKYTWRERFKQQDTAIKKAVWYAERLIKHISEG